MGNGSSITCHLKHHHGTDQLSADSFEIQVTQLFFAGLIRRFAEACDAQSYVRLRRTCRSLREDLTTDALVAQLTSNGNNRKRECPGGTVIEERLAEWMLIQTHIDGPTIFTACCIHGSNNILESACERTSADLIAQNTNEHSLEESAVCPSVPTAFVDVPTNGWELLSPLMICAIRNWEHAACALLDFGADPLLTDWRGMTPLHGAAAAGHEKICLALLRARADVQLRGNHVVRHQTALRMATRECAALIKAHLASQLVAVGATARV